MDSTEAPGGDGAPKAKKQQVEKAAKAKKQQDDLAERHNSKLAALPCLACGKNDDTTNTLLCARPIGRKEGGGFCDKACHVRCTDLEDVPEGDVSEYTVKTDLNKSTGTSNFASSPRGTH